MNSNRLFLIGIHFLLLCIFFFFISYIFRLLSLFYIKFNVLIYLFFDLSFVFFLIFSFLTILNFILKRKISSSDEKRWLTIKPIINPRICVAMTAYNDEESISLSIKDFKNREDVIKVIVIDNNSVDRTFEESINSGAEVIKEPLQGYGACCIRALKEANKTDCNIICLVEGDGTFSGSDLKKLVSYIENADMVIGTRTTRELNTPDSQMNLFMLWGNVFMSKLLQMRFWKVRLTDLGCTYRIIRKEALEKIIDSLSVIGNHFLCEMTILALEKNLKVIEIPITFKKRIGTSKGVGRNIFKGFITGMKMWYLIMFK